MAAALQLGKLAPARCPRPFFHGGAQIFRDLLLRGLLAVRVRHVRGVLLLILLGVLCNTLLEGLQRIGELRVLYGTTREHHLDALGQNRDVHPGSDLAFLRLGQRGRRPPGLGQFAVQGMGCQVVLAHLGGDASPDEQPRVIQGHIQDRILGLVGLGADELGGVHVLPAQIELAVAVVDDGIAPGDSVEAVELVDILDDEADADLPGADYGDGLVEVGDGHVGGKVVQDEAHRQGQAEVLAVFPSWSRAWV